MSRSKSILLGREKKLNNLEDKLVEIVSWLDSMENGGNTSGTVRGAKENVRSRTK